MRNIGLCGVSLLALGVMAGQAGAQGFTVEAGQTVGQQVLNTDGATGLIEAGGTIRTTGFGSMGYGVWSSGNQVVIDNRGTIETQEFNAYGLYSTGADARLINSGAIETQGEGAHGLVSTGPGAQIINSGAIEALGTSASGLYSSGAGAWIVNSGIIRSANTNSIIVLGIDTTLNLLPGSVLIGDLFVRDTVAPTAALNLAPGLSAALNFAATSTFGAIGALPGTIKASGMALVVDTTAMTVTTADVTAPRADGTALADLTGGVFGAVAARGRAGTISAPLAYAPETAPHTAIYGKDEPLARQVWLRGFGGLRDQDGSATSAQYDSRLAGFVSGVDVLASEAGTVGIFLGAAWGTTDVPLSQEVETTSAFGGAYGSLDLGTATLDIGLLLGWSNYDSARRVADMQAPGGLATAEAEYDGFFVSPQVEIMQPFLMGSQRIEARASARYAGLFLDAYEETGTSANLSVDARDVHLFIGRTSLSIPVEYAHADGGVTRLVPTLGLEGRVQFGDDIVTGTLGGAGIAFDAENGETIGFLTAFRAEHETTGNLTLFAEAEGLIEDGGSLRALAKGGVAARF